MPDYDVTVTRVVCQTATIRVAAGTPEEAMELAKERAGDHDFGGLEKDAEYEAQDATEVK